LYTRQNREKNVAENRAWRGGSKSPPPRTGSKYQAERVRPGSGRTLAETCR